jgi:hypothetical protein
LAAAAANSADEADALIIGAGYAVTTPPRDVGVTTNAGLLEKPGTGSSPDTGELPIEVPMVSGTGGVSVTAGTQAGAAATSVALNTPFPTHLPQKNDRFSNHDEALYDEGFDSEGEQMFYDPVALDEDADDFIEEAIASTSSPITSIPAPPIPGTLPPARILTIDMISSLKVKDLKAELQKKGRRMTGNKDVLAS